MIGLRQDRGEIASFPLRNLALTGCEDPEDLSLPLAMFVGFHAEHDGDGATALGDDDRLAEAAYSVEGGGGTLAEIGDWDHGGHFGHTRRHLLDVRPRVRYLGHACKRTPDAPASLEEVHLDRFRVAAQATGRNFLSVRFGEVFFGHEAVEPTAHPKVLRSPADPVSANTAATRRGLRQARGCRLR